MPGAGPILYDLDLHCAALEPYADANGDPLVFSNGMPHGSRESVTGAKWSPTCHVKKANPANPMAASRPAVLKRSFSPPK